MKESGGMEKCTVKAKRSGPMGHYDMKVHGPKDNRCEGKSRFVLPVQGLVVRIVVIASWATL